MNNEKEFLVQKIRANYVEREYTELDKLRMLDCEVRRPVNVFSYVFGSISAIIMGGGMLLFMTVSLITPLSSTPTNSLLCLTFGAAFAIGLGALSNLVLKKTPLV